MISRTELHSLVSDSKKLTTGQSFLKILYQANFTRLRHCSKFIKNNWNVYFRSRFRLSTSELNWNVPLQKVCPILDYPECDSDFFIMSMNKTHHSSFHISIHRWTLSTIFFFSDTFSSIPLLFLSVNCLCGCQFYGNHMYMYIQDFVWVSYQV